MLRRFLQIVIALFLVAAAGATSVALATYDPQDPCLNVISHNAPHNWLGGAGAWVADILIQYFGLLAPSLAIFLFCWAIAVMRHMPKDGFALVQFFATHLFTGLIFTALSALLLFQFASLTHGWVSPQLSWPHSQSLIGGFVGKTLDEVLASTASQGISFLSPQAIHISLTVILFICAVALGLYSIGLTKEDFALLTYRLRHMLWQTIRFPFVVLTFAAHALFNMLRSLPQRGDESLPSSPQLQFAGTVQQDDFHRQDEFHGSESRADPDIFENKASSSEVPSTQVEQDEEPLPAEPEAQKTSVFSPGRILSSLRGGNSSTSKQDRPTSEVSRDDWQYPPLSLLTPPPRQDITQLSQEEMRDFAEKIENTLRNFGVKGEIKGFRTGPVVTLYEFEPAMGVRMARVVGLADDIARPLCVSALRIAPIPGREVMGIEVPNEHRKTVYLAEIFSSSAWKDNQQALPMALGEDIMGNPVIADLADMPHLLVAGTTGSGKSVGVNAMILSLLNRLSPQQCRLLLIDPKMLEFSLYEDIPHLLTPVITDTTKAINALKWLVNDMDRRYNKMSKLKVRNIIGYNARVKELQEKGETVTQQVIAGYDEHNKPITQEKVLTFEPLPYIVVIIDEVADLMSQAGKDIKTCIQRLSQKARAAGIHIIMATQRPSRDVINGVIQANFPARIAFRVGQKIDSRIILDEGGAERLLGQGDMLFMRSAGHVKRVHGPFVSDGEVERTVSFLKEEAEPEYVDGVTAGDEDEDEGGQDKRSQDRSDQLYEEAKEIVIAKNKPSASFLQSYFQIGWNRANRLIMWMEQDHIISETNGSGKRRVLVQNIPSQEASASETS